MFDANRKSAGAGYTTTVAFLVAAFIFSPAMLVVSRPPGYVSASLALACGVLCVALAWVNWRKFSQLSIPSIAPQRATAR
jgi:predicted membrane channel-forming protein YqfA (hemolysin III family)